MEETLKTEEKKTTYCNENHAAIWIDLISTIFFFRDYCLLKMLGKILLIKNARENTRFHDILTDFKYKKMPSLNTILQYSTHTLVLLIHWFVFNATSSTVGYFVAASVVVQPWVPGEKQRSSV